MAKKSTVGPVEIDRAVVWAAREYRDWYSPLKYLLNDRDHVSLYRKQIRRDFKRGHTEETVKALRQYLDDAVVREGFDLALKDARKAGEHIPPAAVDLVMDIYSESVIAPKRGRGRRATERARDVAALHVIKKLVEDFGFTATRNVEGGGYSACDVLTRVLRDHPSGGSKIKGIM